MSRKHLHVYHFSLVPPPWLGSLTRVGWSRGFPSEEGSAAGKGRVGGACSWKDALQRWWRISSQNRLQLLSVWTAPVPPTQLWEPPIQKEDLRDKTVSDMHFDKCEYIWLIASLCHHSNKLCLTSCSVCMTHIAVYCCFDVYAEIFIEYLNVSVSSADMLPLMLYIVFLSSSFQPLGVGLISQFSG